MTPDDPAAIEVIRAFVVGEMPASVFEQRLYGDPGMESSTSQEKAPPGCHAGTTLFHFLIALDYDNPRDVLDAHGALAGFLTKRGVAFTRSSAPDKEHELLLSAQPKWLDADAKFLSDLLAAAPSMARPERKAWLQRRLLELFRFVSRPPRWIQSPTWPMGKEGPMVFLGQLAIEGYFHDNAAVYVFHDPATGECRTITQVA